MEERFFAVNKWVWVVLKQISSRPGVRYILLTTFLFALMQVGVKMLPRLGVMQIVFFRALFALMICWIMLRHKGLRPWGNHKGFLLMRGLCGSAALILFFIALQRIPLATAVTLQYLSPIFTILFAVFIMREPARASQWLAFLVAMIGVAMVKGLDPRVSLLDLGICIASAMFSGLAYNFVRKLKDYDDPLVVVFFFPLVTVPLSLPFMLASWSWPTPTEWLILLAIGFTSQFAQVAMTKAYQLERAADVTIYNYLGIIYAIAFGLALFGEELLPLSAAGIVVVVAGVYLGTIASRASSAKPGPGVGLPPGE